MYGCMYANVCTYANVCMCMRARMCVCDYNDFNRGCLAMVVDEPNYYVLSYHIRIN